MINIILICLMLAAMWLVLLEVRVSIMYLGRDAEPPKPEGMTMVIHVFNEVTLRDDVFTIAVTSQDHAQGILGVFSYPGLVGALVLDDATGNTIAKMNAKGILEGV